MKTTFKVVAKKDPEWGDEVNVLKAVGLRKPKTALEACDVAVQKWDFIAEWTAKNKKTLDDGYTSNTCALCKLFVDQEGDCLNCPIYQVTEEEDCQGTPYRDYVSAETASESAVQAKKMSAFLKRVRDYREAQDKADAIKNSIQ